MAENLALALSVITLFVLCEPRNKVTITSLTDTKGYKSSSYKPTRGEDLLGPERWEVNTGNPFASRV